MLSGTSSDMQRGSASRFALRSLFASCRSYLARCFLEFNLRSASIHALNSEVRGYRDRGFSFSLGHGKLAPLAVLVHPGRPTVACGPGPIALGNLPLSLYASALLL